MTEASTRVVVVSVRRTASVGIRSTRLSGELRLSVTRDERDFMVTFGLAYFQRLDPLTVSTNVIGKAGDVALRQILFQKRK